MRYTLLAVLLVTTFVQSAAVAQDLGLSGTIVDSLKRTPVVNANVVLVERKDTSSKQFSTTNLDGEVFFLRLKPGSYSLRVTHLGYKKVQMSIDIRNASYVFDT